MTPDPPGDPVPVAAAPDPKAAGPAVCPECGGTGQVGPERCEACDGTGAVEETNRGG